MKVIVKAEEGVNLIDPHTRVILTEKPILTPWTEFLNKRSGLGQVIVLASKLPDEASAEEFQKFLEDAEDEELAVAAFKSTFEKDEPAPAKAQAKTKAKPAPNPHAPVQDPVDDPAKDPAQKGD